MHVHASAPAPVGDRNFPLPEGLMIRRITLDDAARIRQYIEFSNTHDTPPAVTLEMLRASVDRPGRRARWIAVRDGQVVGIASVAEWVEQRDGSYFANVVASQADAGRGYRSALAETVRAFVLDGGGRMVFVNSRDTLPGEVEFWTARGLRVVEEHPAVSLDVAGALDLPAMPDVAGLELVTLAERPELERPLWEAATASIWPDEPTDIEIVEHEPFAEFQRYIHRHPC